MATISAGTFFIAFFVSSVMSAEFTIHKRISREVLEDDTRVYDSNHTPIPDNSDTIPVTTIYDDYDKTTVNESASVINKSDNLDEPTKITLTNTGIIKDVKKYLEVNQEHLEPIVSTLKIDEVTSNGSIQTQTNGGTAKVLSNSKKNNTITTQRRRLQEVRKVNVKKSKTTVETKYESSTAKTFQKDKKYSSPKITTEKIADKLESTTTEYVLKNQKRNRTRDPVVPIIESENYVYSHRGNFHYSYEGGDGTKAFGRGELRMSENGSGMGEAVEGSFSYTDKDGNDFSLSYTADENGYRPVGAHLPTPPPIPPEIQAALRLLATKTTPEPVTEKVTKTS